MIYTSFDDIPRKHYGVIYADPAWHHVSYSTKGQARSPSRHYDTMSLEEIMALPVKEIAAKDCHLMMWTTQPHLEQSFAILKAWGFRYSSVFQFWLKLNPRAADEMFLERSHFHRGMGFTTRKNVEPLLLGRRGSPKRLVKDVPDFIIAARRQHSRKPDAMIPTLERYAPGPRIELFSRESRPGWDAWGNQAGKFDAGATGKVSPQEYVLGRMFGPPWPWPATPLLDVQS